MNYDSVLCLYNSSEQLQRATRTLESQGNAAAVAKCRAAAALIFEAISAAVGKRVEQDAEVVS